MPRQRPATCTIRVVPQAHLFLAHLLRTSTRMARLVGPAMDTSRITHLLRLAVTGRDQVRHKVLDRDKGHTIPLRKGMARLAVRQARRLVDRLHRQDRRIWDSRVARRRP